MDAITPRTALPPLPEFMEDPANHVNVRRLLAASVDLVCWFLTLTIPDLLLGNELYRQTLFIWLPLTFFLYFAVPEGLTGYTPGKWIFRARVLGEAGGLPGLKAGMTRSILRVFEGIVFFVPAAFFALSSRRNQRLGDYFAGTYVMSSQHAALFLTKRDTH